MAKRTITDSIPLSNGHAMPQLGFGVYLSPQDVCLTSCLTALRSGYRHIDTAQYYANEAQVGAAVQQSGLSRRDIFLTTKILSPAGSVDASYAACVASVDKLDPAHGYVDLFLIHSPHCGAEGRAEMWRALERLHAEGKARSIGVSNFGISHVEELRAGASVWPPHVAQLELHPWSQQRDIDAYCRQNGIAVQAYCPIVRNKKAGDPTLTGIARKHGAQPNQVLIRYGLQKGWAPLPKSDDAGRIAANADVFGFELDEEDMAALDGLDQGAAGAIVEAVEN
jgi:diketogulonate reductase-like aldo/keto reductase